MRVVRQRQTEKPCKTDGCNGMIDKFECAAEHLGAHVDAEGGLQEGPLALRGRAIECRGKAALVAVIGRVLQDCQRHVLGGRADRHRMSRDGCSPAVGDLRRA